MPWRKVEVTPRNGGDAYSYEEFGYSLDDIEFLHVPDKEVWRYQGWTVVAYPTLKPDSIGHFTTLKRLTP